MWLSFTKSLIRPLSIIVPLQMILAAGITYFEAEQYYKLNEKFETYERKMNMHSI